MELSSRSTTSRDDDIIFMDVEMPGLDGFGAAEKIRAVDADAVLVFVTNMAQYASRATRWTHWTMSSSR